MDNAYAIPRPEHPRPDFMRDTFLNLNGTWQFAFDDRDEGEAGQWQRPEKAFPMEIQVPFAYQTKLSGIGPTDEIHPILWYRRRFTLPHEMHGRRILIRFGAVDYACVVFVNGHRVGSHEGGYTPFAFDITCALQEGENDLCLRVADAPDCTQPRGKQYWKRGVMSCWYTPVSGIWQTVYMEAVGERAIRYVHITPDIDRAMATMEIAFDGLPDEHSTLEIDVLFQGERVRKLIVDALKRVVRVPFDLQEDCTLEAVHLWSPDSPNLYDVSLRLRRGECTLDHVTTYFGMRKIEVVNGQVALNNKKLYQRLVLDQGYWPDSLLTPPTDEAIRKDVQMTKALGYNGARKHQKIEDPRYYYWADRLGLLVWGELPSPYDFTDDVIRRMSDMMLAFIARDFNHPSIIVWVPLNESWGVRQIYTEPRQQALARMLYHATKAADGTRLCSSNDGWEQTETDICALHDYLDKKEIIEKHFDSREAVEAHGCDIYRCYAKGIQPTGDEAFMVTEYGGIAMQGKGDGQGSEAWGYHGKVQGEDAFFARFQETTDAIRAIPYCQGYCYTQLTDVMQEVNGVLTPDREPKVSIERFAKINRNPLGFR